MSNYCYYSLRLMNWSTIRSLNCRNFCTFCKQNVNKYNISNRFESQSTKTNSSPLLSFKNNLKSFESKNYLSTTFQRNQRLNQIYRNVNKDKAKQAIEEPINEWKELSEMSLFQRLKVMFKKYWYISIPVHCVTSCLWFGFLYLIAKSGFDVKPLLDKIMPLIEKLPLPEFVKKIFKSDTNSTSLGYVAVAFVMYKLVTPARYATTVTTSFYAIKYFVKRGLIKPVPSKDQIKAQVIRSRGQLNQVLRDRLKKREDVRKQNKNRKKPVK